jgi:hypothetical protein
MYQKYIFLKLQPPLANKKERRERCNKPYPLKFNAIKAHLVHHERSLVVES